MITGVVLARNEELNIEACLTALRPHVAELFLIDMESTDRTVDLARPYIDRVLSHRLVGNFDAARNIAIPLAAYEWLWFVDADEIVPAETGRQVNELLRAHPNEFEAIAIPFKNYFCGHWMQHNGWWPGYTCCRVLKRGYFEFSRILHGGVQLTGRQIRFPASAETAIPHYSFRSLEHYVAKFNRYTTVEAKQLHEQGGKYHWRGAVRAMLHDLWNHYEFNDARQDGTWGWVVAWQAAQYRWMSYTKMLDEIQATNEALPDSAPESLAELFNVMEEELASFRRFKPKLPLGLIADAEVNDLTKGMPTVAARILALARLGRPLQWRHGASKIQTREEKGVDDVLWTLDHVRRPGHGITIFLPSRRLPSPDARSVFSVYWEISADTTSELNMEDRAALRQFDSVWVSSVNRVRAMRELGAAEERLSIIRPWIDSQVFTPLGPHSVLEEPAPDGIRLLVIADEGDLVACRQVFSALCQSSSISHQPVTMLVGHRSGGLVEDSINECIRSLRSEHLNEREHIRVRPVEPPLDGQGQAELIRAVNVLVIIGDQTGDHWALAALACGRPVAVIGNASAEDFECCGAYIRVPAQSKSPSQNDSAEIGTPIDDTLSTAIDKLIAKAVSTPLLDAAHAVHERYGEAAAQHNLKQAVAQLEDRLRQPELPAVQSQQLRITLEGEICAAHSFSNINEILAEGFSADPSLALRIERRFIQPTFDDRHPRRLFLDALVQRTFPDGPEITIRHAFPPNWDPPRQGLWVHIQYWEYGYLPRNWLPPLLERVTEVWAPSQYVRRVYVSSGIPDEKIKVIPWGCNPLIYRPDAPPLRLPTTKTFRFLFVGGTIRRKGFDRLLDAYLAEFRRNEDVCLVIKDMGTSSFYRDGYGEQIQEAIKDPSAAEIVYFSDDFLPSQLASLYTACHCLVAPYRGEGFGLPVLEAMACGLAAIVTDGGPTDDFVSNSTGYRVPSREVEMTGLPDLCQPGLEYDVSVTDLRTILRHAFEHAHEVRQRGQLASRTIRDSWTWDTTIRRMTERLWALSEAHLGKSRQNAGERIEQTKSDEQPIPSGLAARQGQIQHRKGMSLGSETTEHTEHRPLTALRRDPESLIAMHAPTGRRRCVLIQMATGSHRQLLDITRAHHESYAARHEMDFWRIEENPAEPKRAGWGKVSLLLRALREGYEHAIWIDADAVIARSSVDLSKICTNGLGLVQHPNIEARQGRRYRIAHWNTGVIVAAKSPLVEAFLAEVNSQPENESAWMEQLALNEVMKEPQFRAIVHALPPAFNATPGAVVVPQPVVWAAHGWPFEQRLSFLKDWLCEITHSAAHNGKPINDAFRICRRTEFADHLNDLGLTGSAVEVGVLRGEFSKLFLDRWKGETLHLVDPWRSLEGYIDVSNLSSEEHKQALEEVHQNLDGHAGRYEICRKLSAEAAPHFADASLDFVYIDANHEYQEVINDIWRWYPKLRQGGVLAGHDCVDGLFPEGEFGVKFAVHEFEQQTGLKANYTDEGRWTSWYFYRV